MEKRVFRVHFIDKKSSSPIFAIRNVMLGDSSQRLFEPLLVVGKSFDEVEAKALAYIEAKYSLYLAYI